MNERLYANLARDLHGAISGGDHKPGTMLPGEHELAATHGVSRQTVRAALNLLERNGLVERRRGAGTFVLEPRPALGFGQSVLSTEELVHYARETHRVVRRIEQIVVDKVLAEAIGVSPGSRWLHLESARIDPARPNKPICESHAYVEASLFQITDYLDDEKTLLCDLIAKHCGVQVHSIEQELQGAIIPDESAARLGETPGSPALRILRRYRDASGWVFLSTISVHPADRFTYRMKLARSEATT